MSIDLNPVQPIVTPAKAAISYDLTYITKLLLEGNLTAMRAYAEMTPFRRIYADVPYVVTEAQPILDAEGQPVLDADGMPTYTEPVMGVHENQLVGAELMLPTAEGFRIIPIDVPNILEAVSATPEADTKTSQALQAFLMSGGDLGSLTMACLTLMVRQVAIAQGKLQA